MEVWKDIPGYNNHYQASNLGNIRVKDRVVQKKCGLQNYKVVNQFYKGRLLKQTDSRGYKKVTLGFDDIYMNVGVHVLVAKAFHDDIPFKGAFCLHADSNPSNNTPENLRWGNQFDNMADRKALGNYYTGELHPMCKIKKETVDYIRTCKKSGVELSKELGLGQSQISRIRKGQSWK